MALTKVTTGGIKDGTITNEDISTTTSISQDKLAATPGASSIASGLMIPADKNKLDGVADNANNYSHPSAHTVSEVTGLQGLLDGKTTESYVNTQITNVIGAAPAALDTLTELAAALGDDANYAATVTTALAGKVDDSQVLTNVPSGAVFTDTNTTYSVGDGGLTQKNFTSADNTKLDGIETGATADQSNEEIQDIAGAMWANNTESGVSVTYQDTDGTMDINVNDPTISLSGDVVGSATMSNLGNVSINTTIADDSHNHVISNVDNLQAALDAKSGLTYSGFFVGTTGLNLSNATDLATFNTQKDTFYPVMFDDINWNNGTTRLNITRANIHGDNGLHGNWWGSLLFEIEFRKNYCGHGCSFHKHTKHLTASAPPGGFIVRYDEINSNGGFWIWLRGQTTYYASANGIPHAGDVYLNGKIQTGSGCSDHNVQPYDLATAPSITTGNLAGL